MRDEGENVMARLRADGSIPPEQWDELTRCCQEVYRIFRRRGLSHDDAEDLRGEVFLKVFHNLPRFRGESSLRTWVYHIAFNTGNDFFAKRSKREILESEMRADETEDKPMAEDKRKEHEPAVGEVPIEPVEVVMQHEWQAAVRKAVEQLPEDQRVAIRLFYFEEVEQSEIAAVMGRSVPAVKMLLNRARKMLKGLLEPLEREYVCTS